MASEWKDDERRRSVRMTSHTAGKTRLRIGSKNLPAHVVDTSSGGYRVEVLGTPKAKVDQPVELISPSGRSPLRIVWHCRIDNTTSMGLRHVAEELPWRQDTSWMIWMLLAVILGLGLGAFFALGDNPALWQIAFRARV